jgi:hypothetical protein
MREKNRARSWKYVRQAEIQRGSITYELPRRDPPAGARPQFRHSETVPVRYFLKIELRQDIQPVRGTNPEFSC